MPTAGHPPRRWKRLLGGAGLPFLCVAEMQVSGRPFPSIQALRQGAQDRGLEAQGDYKVLKSMRCWVFSGPAVPWNAMITIMK